MKDWIQTHTGLKFYPLKPRTKDFSITDQARALSMICRFGGHVDRFYSVAEHAVRMSWHVKSLGYGLGVQAWALAHDNAEAYYGDMCRPLKHAPGMEVYRNAEKRCGRMIFKWLGLRGKEPQLIKDLDTEILGTEAPALKSPVHPDWGKTTATGRLADPWFDVTMSTMGWEPRMAERMYLHRFVKLWPAGVP